MPAHDWTSVEAGIFYAFRHQWVTELSRALNREILPDDHYAMIEPRDASDRPTFAPTAESDLEFYRRKQSALVVRHVSGDRVVATIEIVSPGNKSTRHAMRSFVEKAAELLERRVHLLILDLSPPGPRDPHGIHAAIWDEVAGTEFVPPAGEPLTFVAYETALTVRAYVWSLSVGAGLPEMPPFLEPNGCVPAPLEATYQAAFEAMPRRWRGVLAPGG